MSRMTDEDLGQLLGKMPRNEAASSDFTQRVVDKLERRLEAHRRRPARLRALGFAVAALLLGVAALTGHYLRERMERSKAAERVRELRAEYRHLQEELDKLRALTQEIQPVLDVGGTEQVDFVIDLRELARQRDRGERPAVAPASPSRSRDGAREKRR